MTPTRTVQKQAKEFALWRAASSLSWECTISQAARIAGITPNYAGVIAKRKGWLSRFSDEKRIDAMRRGRAVGMRRIGWSVDENLLDLTELMK